jgi:hypothetical protein
LRFTPDLRQVTLIIRSVSIHNRGTSVELKGVRQRTRNRQAIDDTKVLDGYKVSIMGTVPLSSCAITDLAPLRQTEMRSSLKVGMTTKTITKSTQDPQRNTRHRVRTQRRVLTSVDGPAELNVVARSLPLLGIPSGGVGEPLARTKIGPFSGPRGDARMF